MPALVHVPVMVSTTVKYDGRTKYDGRIIGLNVTNIGMCAHSSHKCNHEQKLVRPSKNEEAHSYIW